MIKTTQGIALKLNTIQAIYWQDGQQRVSSQSGGHWVDNETAKIIRRRFARLGAIWWAKHNRPDVVIAMHHGFYGS